MTTTAGTGPFPSGTLMQSFISSPSTLTLSHKGAIACLLELGVATSTPGVADSIMPVPQPNLPAHTPAESRVRVLAGHAIGAVGPPRPVRSAKSCDSGERVKETVGWPQDTRTRESERSPRRVEMH